MNQTKNLIQYKNLTDEQKAEHDFENYKYEAQMAGADDNSFYVQDKLTEIIPHKALVYRLKIEPGKWYCFNSEDKKPHPITGHEIIQNDKNGIIPMANFEILRPAKPDEIPKPKRVFKDGAFYPVILIVGDFDGHDVAEFKDNGFRAARHLNTGSEGGDFPEDRFSWIGEELKIEWGE